jgi:sirohydrochlorin ferrochelatase
VEDLEIVNRQPDGSYILGGSAVLGVPAVANVFGQDLADTIDQEDAAIARKYFTSGAHMGSKGSRHAEDGE